MDVEHELRGLVPAVAEQLLEDEDHVRHQVDRVVPHDHDPRDLGLDDLLVDGFVDLDGLRLDRSGLDGSGRRHGDTIRRPSHEEGAISRCDSAPATSRPRTSDGLRYPVTRGSTYHARNARIARTMITIAEYLMAAYPTSELDSGSWIVGGSCTCSS